MQLVIGNKLWSTWSMRPWLVLKRAGIAFDEVMIALRQGDAVVFTVNQRPAMGQRGARRVAMRHGVSRIRSGRRHTIGLIFHDSR